MKKSYVVDFNKYYLNKWTYLFFFMMSVSCMAFCQLPQNKKEVKKDSIPHLVYHTPHFIRPLADLTAINLFMNRFDVYVYKKSWANVSPSSWWFNLERGMMTDGDAFPTNWLGHPIHGSLFYNAARANHLNFWQAMPYVATGSLMWEFLGETEPASHIDVYTTTLGGIFLGEAFYRLTDYAWNNPSAQQHPLFADIAGSLINPVAAINRFMFGNTIPFTTSSLTPVTMEWYLGTIYPFYKIMPKQNTTGMFLATQLTYGDLFDRSKEKFGPFDYFRMTSWLNISDNPASTNKVYFNLSSDAVILGSKITNTPDKTELISLTQHYDFIHNDLFKIGSVVLTGDWTTRHTYNNLRITSSTKLGVVLFGSGNSELVTPVLPGVFPDFERDYIYGQGFMGEVECMVQFRNFGTVASNLTHFIIYSKSQPQGVENLDLLRAKYLYPLSKNFMIGLQFDYYHRNAEYYVTKEINTTRKSHQELKLVFGYSL